MTCAIEAGLKAQCRPVLPSQRISLNSTVCAALSVLLTPMRANTVFPSARVGKVGD